MVYSRYDENGARLNKFKRKGYNADYFMPKLKKNQVMQYKV